MEPKKEIKEELEQISPFLAGLDKKNNFKVPVNYFEEMQEELWQKVGPKAQEKPVVVPKKTWLTQLDELLAAWFQPRLALSLASLLLLLMAGWYFMQKTDNSVDLLAATEVLSLDDEAYDYFLQHLDEFDADFLLTALEVDVDELNDVAGSNSSEDDDFDAVLEDLLEDLDTDELEQFL